MERTILHLDMDSFFASCEQQRRPGLRGRPIAVSGDPKSRSVVAAASIQAKKFGVRSAMSIGQARALCPQIQFVLGDPDYYISVSRKVMEILRRVSDVIEVASIDEAYVDLTGWAEREIGYELPVTSYGLRFYGALKIVERIKDALRREVGEYNTASAGIAENKRLAKLASDRNKPNGITLIENIDEWLPKLALRDFCGLGPATERRLGAFGIKTPLELSEKSSEWLCEHFGAQGRSLWEMVRGIDEAPVVGEPDEPKSMGHQVTLPRDVSDPVELIPVIAELADAVAVRLRNDGYVGRTVHLRLRFSDFSDHGEQITLGVATSDGRIITRAATNLLGSKITKSVRLVGVSVSKLERPINSLLVEDQRWIRVWQAVDHVNARHGERVLERGILTAREQVKRKVAAAFGAARHLMVSSKDNG